MAPRTQPPPLKPVPYCPACPRLRGPVPPSGPRPCQFLFIGEAPHKQEDRRGFPFAGPTGQEFNSYYLPIAGLRRPDVGVTNASQCSLGGYRNPDHAHVAICAAHHLPYQLAQFDPEIVVLMGSAACSLAYPEINLESQHGIPMLGKIFNWLGVIVPMYHPSAGIHDSRMMIQLQRDFPILSQVAQGLESNPVENNLDTDWGLIESPNELRDELALAQGSIAVDTETDCQGFDLDPFSDPPYMLSFTVRPGRGRAILYNPADAIQRKLIAQFHGWISETRPQVVLHNSLFDIPVLRRMGVDIPWSRVHDTMEDAYLTGYLPQGLKALAYRHLGIEMTEYNELTRAYSREEGLRYLLRLSTTTDIPQPWLAPRQWKIHRKAQSALDACLDGKADPQDRFRNWHNEQPLDTEAAESRLGRFPYRSIRHVPLSLAVKYACVDADATMRIRPVIARELVNLRRKVA